MLQIEERRAVGFVSTLLSNECALYEVATRTLVEESSLERVSVLGVWVCNSRRRSGLGVALVREVQRVRDARDNKLSWVTPFSDKGLSLARRFAVDGKLWI